MEQTVNKLFDLVKDTISISTLEKIKFCYNEEGDHIYDEFEEETGIDAKHGCTKMVLFFDEIDDYVIKIPFQGTRSVYWDEDLEEYVLDRQESEYFQCANNRVDCEEWDYCEAEELLYKKAEGEGIEEFFTKTFHIGDIDGYPIYAAEKVVGDWCDIPYTKKKVSQDSIKKMKSLHSSGIRIDLNDEAIAVFIEQYGYEKTYQLINFICEYQLEDFHSGNVGFDKDYKLKIIDYSCYDG